MRPMYEIAAEFKRIADQIDENGGELTPELEAAFDAIQGEFRHKADNYLALIVDFEAYAKSLEDQCARLIKLRGSALKTAARLRDRLLAAHDAAGAEGTIRTERFKFGVRKAQKSYQWPHDAIPIPSELQRHRIEFDATKARALDKEGRLPDGVKVSQKRYIKID